MKLRRSALLLVAALPLSLIGCAEQVDEHPAEDSTEAVFTEDDAKRVEDRSQELFTQGLEFAEDGSLFHSGGRYGESRVVKTDPSGAVIAEYELPDEHFAEGLTVVDDEVYLLTWRENVVHVLSADDLTPLRTFPLETEGWGTCYSDDGQLWVSDGTAEVRGYDPASMIEQTSRTIVDGGGDEIEGINELECIGDEIWANLWQEELVIVFDRGTGEIVRMLDFSDLTPEWAGNNEVLNGIAFDAEADEIWLTGKLWEHFFIFDYAELRGAE
ncbi:glutaminyl-peptide cyclotransferase [uncultured Agrococcus sp.]|uniref:glutaminyl-peptide cyclotransferase n=1 Tax=uncultured Agrococcus sp. TaxID=382258 RepID=UPI0025D0E87A|nr:glutaminyl-peptide cyclotransferase [uncultured Agrococcus sp.]